MCMSAVDSVLTLSVFCGLFGVFFTVSPFRPPTRDQPCLSVTRTTRRRWNTPPSRSTRTSANTTIIWPRFWLLLCMSGWGANKHPVDLLWMMSFRLGLITQVFIKNNNNKKKKIPSSFSAKLPSVRSDPLPVMVSAVLCVPVCVRGRLFALWPC